MYVKSFVVFFSSLITVFSVYSNVASAATYGSGKYGNCDYGYESGCSISISTIGSVSLPLLPAVGGTTSISSDTIYVTTNSLSGYTLAFSNSSDVQAAMISGEDELGAHGALSSSPSTLAINTWGWRVDGLANFGSGPTDATINNPTSTDLFAGVPLSGSPYNIRINNSGAVTDDETRVWYGVRADTTQPSGTYTATVTYTATANP